MNLPRRNALTGRIEMTKGVMGILVGLLTSIGMLVSATAFVLNKDAKIEDAAPKAMLIDHMRADSTWQREHERHDSWQDSIIAEQQRNQKSESERGRALNCFIANNPVGFCDDVRALQRNILNGRK
jgi:hypothetical protein